MKNPQVDWQQVVLNGGPPCFFVEGPQYCGRAERWQGHGNAAFHDYISLDDLLTTVHKEARQAAFKTALGQVKLLWSTSNSNSYNGAVTDAVRKIEAAGNDEEGGGNG